MGSSKIQETPCKRDAYDGEFGGRPVLCGMDPALVLIKHNIVMCFSLIFCQWGLSFCRRRYFFFFSQENTCVHKEKPSGITVSKTREREKESNHCCHCWSLLIAPISSGQGERGHVATVLKETIMMLSFRRHRQSQWGGWSSELTMHKIIQISSLPAQYVSD